MLEGVVTLVIIVQTSRRRNTTNRRLGITENDARRSAGEEYRKRCVSLFVFVFLLSGRFILEYLISMHSAGKKSGRSRRIF
jgi:hypothetical protein